MSSDETEAFDALFEDRLCGAEWPGDDIHIGQLCELDAGHPGLHSHETTIGGTRYTRTLTWSDA